MSIPKRQPDEPTYSSVAALIDHEHAVAKHAVNVLQELRRMADDYPSTEADGSETVSARQVSDAASDALEEIEASGWKP